MLQEKILKTIRKYNLIQKGDKIVIGVSGGPDSMCLLDCLYCMKKDLYIDLVVVHINHMLRNEAEEETKYVQEYCKKNGIACFVKYSDINKIAQKQKLGIEATAREVRYNFFTEIAEKIGANKIATAHTANDNAETILMNLLRGSGTSGLKGIEIKSKKYIRPLRECERIEIEEYCKENKLNPKIDKSNFENIYTRNKIRNELIPYLQNNFNPNIIQGLNRLSDLAKEEDEYFKQIVKKEYENLKLEENDKGTILNLKEFNNLSNVIKGKLILYTINKVVGTTQGVEKINIEDLIKLCKNNIGNKYLMPNKNIKVYVKQGKIFFIKQ